MLHLPPALAVLLAELPDEDLADVCADLPDLSRALAVVDLVRVTAALDARVRLQGERTAGMTRCRGPKSVRSILLT
jgi:hypothetical protein